MTTPSMRPAEAARAWVEAWSDGWRDHDPERIAERYGDECVFSSHPFRQLRHGRQGALGYVREAFAQESTARFAFAEPIVANDGRAAVEYRAVISGIDNTVSTLAGTTVLRFGPDGLVLEHRDYWAITDGDRGLEPETGAQR
jgi:ketosteroid isomerase-like protein